MPKRPKTIPAVIIIVLVALDLATKHMAASSIPPGEPVVLAPFFQLVNIENTGAAFGMMHGMGNMFFILVSVAAISFVWYLMATQRAWLIPLSMIMGGAIGNLTDRLWLGHVRDFLDFHMLGHHWPAFNVADAALTVGIALLLFTSHQDNQNTRG